MARRLPNLDSVTTIDEDGSRNFLHPADVKGNFTVARRLFAIFLVAIYIALPLIPINGHPAVFLDVINRRFHLFGLTFAAQDLWLAFFFISGLGFLLFFITSLFGRLWCGWACPYSVFMEQVFRNLERLFEGTALNQRKLDRMSWAEPQKILRRGGKTFVFLIVSALIAHIFLAYFISIPQLWSWMAEGPVAHPQAFVFIIVATAIMMFVFSWFREQLCLVICPYGRLQSALIDDDTMIIGYDEKRGEPRGRDRGKERVHGDCINCFRCVQVCPTGIDIRHGLQIECIACANCIDACNAVMDELGRKRGLVRYDSLNGLEGKKRRWIRPRLFVYSLFLLLGASVMTYSFSMLRPVHMQVMRMQGMPYYLRDAILRNQFQVRVINKQEVPLPLNVSVESGFASLDVSGAVGRIEVPPDTEEVLTLVLTVPASEWKGRFSADVRVAGDGNDGRSFTIEKAVEFLGPDPEMLRKALQSGNLP